MREFRTLKPTEIQVRPTDTKYKGSAMLLLYKDARVDMQILDETVGQENWQKRYYEVKGNLYCSVGIRIDNEWIWKDDCGVESNTECEKGEASDAFKRACFNWGVGRELYSTPKIKIQCPDSYYYNDKMTMTFTVADIAFNDNKQCTKLVIVDRFNNVVFDWNNGQQNNTQQQKLTSPKQQKLTTGTNMSFVIKEQPKDSKSMIPKYAYAQIKNAKSLDELKSIWNNNVQWQQNANFLFQMKTQKAALTAS